MANGYVQPFMRAQPHPFFPQHPLQRQLAQQQRLAQAQRGSSPNPNVPPSALFAQARSQQGAQQPVCMFPNAFPAEGPNIFQRFWIWLFHLLMTPAYLLWGYAQALYTAFTEPDSILRLNLRRDTDREMLTIFLLDNSWSLLIGFVVIVVVSVLAWFFSPKGENNTVWRSTIILTAASCYIMWAITFLAQWHPLIPPKVVKLREGYAGMS